MKAYMVKENKEMDIQKLVELEGEIDKPTIRAGDFNMPDFSNRKIQQADIKNIVEINGTIN